MHPFLGIDLVDLPGIEKLVGVSLVDTLLDEHIEKIRVDLQPEQRDIMIEKTGRRTVPQIYVGDTHVGGFDDLSALDRAGGLDPLLAA